jgi:hypothetical protein
MRKFLYIVFALNLIGVACFCASQQTQTQIERQSFSCAPDATYLLQTIGYTLMLPGVFFASATLLVSRFFALNHGAELALWHITGMFMNLFFAWRVGIRFEGTRDEE